MTEAQKKELERALWGIANDLRGKMDADEFRDYILGFIFFKYLSERIELYANDILQPDGIAFTAISEATEEGNEILEAVRLEAVEELGYFLKPSELFASIAQRGGRKGDNFILDDLTRILENIQKSTMGAASEEDFNHLFEDMDLGSTKLGRTVSDRNELVAKIMSRLAGLDFRLRDVNSDLLGDAYEYLIGKFASGAGKKAGEFYTPQQVSTVLARIVTTGRDRLQNVYDPTCGSGSLLLRVAREVGLRKVGQFYGQELNRTTYNLARMNMILHGVSYRKFNLKQEDTLERPQHDGKYEAVVANPPFSANWSANPQFSTDDRFSTFGRLPPASKADFAFVLHMVHHLADNGVMAVILPHGVLFRSGAEGEIRKTLVGERNYLDAVIGLPENIFYGTGIPTCILVFKKCRENPGDVLFIDARDSYERGKNQNILSEDGIRRIVDTFRKRDDNPRFSRVVSLDEIERNKYNLNIPRYVDRFVAEPRVAVSAVVERAAEFAERRRLLERQIADICQSLGRPFPAFAGLNSLNKYKKGILQDIVDRRIRFRDESGRDYPDWQPVSLGQVFAERSERGAPDRVLLSVTLGRGVVPASEVERVNEASADRSNYKSVQPGDIAYNTMRMWQGASGLSSLEGIVSPAYTVISPRAGQCGSFWAQMFKRRDVVYLFERYSQGLTSDTWNLKYPSLAEIVLHAPAFDEQVKIAGLLDALDELVSVLCEG
jgi:type I restriction enzyme M protein